MSQYIVSARKYRPDSFETLLGQDNIARTLSNLAFLQRGEQYVGVSVLVCSAVTTE